MKTRGQNVFFLAFIIVNGVPSTNYVFMHSSKG